jgi:hypothetical protein
MAWRNTNKGQLDSVNFHFRATVTAVALVNGATEWLPSWTRKGRRASPDTAANKKRGVMQRLTCGCAHAACGVLVTSQDSHSAMDGFRSRERTRRVHDRAVNLAHERSLAEQQRQRTAADLGASGRSRISAVRPRLLPILLPSRWTTPVPGGQLWNVDPAHRRQQTVLHDLPKPTDQKVAGSSARDVREMSEAPVIKAVTSAEVRRSAQEPARAAYPVVRKQRHADRIPPS